MLCCMLNSFLTTQKAPRIICIAADGVAVIAAAYTVLLVVVAALDIVVVVVVVAAAVASVDLLDHCFQSPPGYDWHSTC
jgi:hypothetical protein